MSTFFGADVDELRQLAGTFENAAAQLSRTRTSVGGNVQSSPWTGPVAFRFRSSWDSQSSTQLAAAADRLTNAAVSLRRNAAEQEGASAASGLTPSLPTVLGLGLAPLIPGGANFFTFLEGGADKVQWMGMIPEIWSQTWALTHVSGVRTLSALAAAEAYGVAQGGKWMSALGTIADMPVVKGLGVIGAAFSVVKAVDTWTDPRSTTWDKTRDSVSAGLAVAGTALLFTPAAPIGAAIDVVAGAWQIGTLISDNHVQIGHWAEGAAQNMATGAQVVERSAAMAVNEAAKAGEQAATNIFNGAVNAFKGFRFP